jgi:Smg protein
MHDRFGDLLTLLRARFSSNLDVAEVEAYLSSEGYDRGQIGEILSLLLAELPGRTAIALPVIQTEMTFRVMGPHERGRFAPEAWGHLLSLSSSGALSSAELEQVIERVLSQIEGQVDIGDVMAALGTDLPDDPRAPTNSSTVH